VKILDTSPKTWCDSTFFPLRRLPQATNNKTTSIADIMDSTKILNVIELDSSSEFEA
jgi:hypothetical protein